MRVPRVLKSCFEPGTQAQGLKAHVYSLRVRRDQGRALIQKQRPNYPTQAKPACVGHPERTQGKIRAPVGRFRRKTTALSAGSEARGFYRCAASRHIMRVLRVLKSCFEPGTQAQGLKAHVYSLRVRHDQGRALIQKQRPNYPTQAKPA
jgi:hypothetical protein